jgi:hypothetical protein
MRSALRMLFPSIIAAIILTFSSIESTFIAILRQSLEPWPCIESLDCGGGRAYKQK